MFSILLDEGYRCDGYHEFALVLCVGPIRSQRRKKPVKLSRRQRAKRLAGEASKIDFQDFLKIRSWINDAGQ